MAALADSHSLNGKNILITGASGGIGQVTARELARRGAHLILVCRSPEKAEQTKALIQQATPESTPDILLCDLSRLSEVRTLAAEVVRRYPKLDVLINNAGLMPGPLTITDEGHELSWVTNHLAPFLLTNLLLPLLDAAGQARIINVASEAHWLGEIEPAQTFRNAPDKYSSFTAYCDSKLANILFTNELAHRLELTGITANCLHPGIVDTGLVNPGSSRSMKLLWWLARPVMVTAEVGAKTTIYLATDPQVAAISGRYFKNSKPARTSATAQNRAEASRLWRISEEEAGLD
ncbi:SDR family oxidoreductase [Hymenobacter cellulosivorans]|uniref:SDR family oxidoreductase n=1 Tax=Hymenobacter cellulosivorans TaxID=2932249 RepID=A0ABY4F5I9_9BACT|nr:SDR family oxidoreductase [Hymenobacter cellulosivorans]UOQ51937.1 SDR family oxidoreductase [Hymenobacter cellulosivorans]